MNASRRFAVHLLPNLIAGLTSGLVNLVYSVSFAALIFSEKLSAHFPQGLGTAILGAAITSVIVGWRSPFPFAIAGPEANSAIVIALAGRAIAQSLSAPGEEQFVYPTVWATIILSSSATGLCLYLLGRFRLGQLARYVPYPVVGGFLAGTGCLIARSSFKVMTGLPLAWGELPRFIEPAIGGQCLTGLAVAVSLYLILSRFKHFLVLPGVLLLGTALGNLVRSVVQGRGGSADSWFFESFSNNGVWQAWNYATIEHIDWSVLAHQGGTIIAMVVIVVLSILLNATGVELATSRNVDLNEELRADGLANLVNGACGGLVGYISINRCLLNQRAGATSPLAAIVAGLFCGCVLIFGSTFLAHVPKPLLGGLLLYIGGNLLTRWLFRSWSQLPRFDYLLVVTITIIILAVGFIAGVSSGILIACLLFIVSYGKTPSIKYELTGRTYHSNFVRSERQQELLDRDGESIKILVLHGFVFFGTANDLLDGIRRQLTSSALQKLQYVVFDFRLVTGLDSSAVLSFTKLEQLAQSTGLSLVFTSLSPAIEEQFCRGGLPFGRSRFRVFQDLDHGMEWCENQILQEHRLLECEAIPFRSQLQTLLKSAEMASELLPYLQQVDLAPNQRLFCQDDRSDGLYFMESGRVSVVVELSRIRLRRRTYTSGTILGEMGFYSGAPRSATVIAEEPSRLHYLSNEAFARIEATMPLTAASFNKRIVNLIAERLRRSEDEVKMLLQ